MNQDPLAELRDIYAPDAVSWWPPAPGWWILAGLIIALLIAAAIWRYQSVQRNRYRGEAVQALSEAWKKYLANGDAETYLLALTQILKRTALTAYPNLPISSMQGNQWLALLDDSLPDNSFQFLQGPGQQLLELPYRKPNTSTNIQPLHDLCLRWLSQHRSQREITKSNFQPKSLTFSGARNAAA